MLEDIELGLGPAPSADAENSYRIIRADREIETKREYYDWARFFVRHRRGDLPALPRNFNFCTLLRLRTGISYQKA